MVKKKYIISSWDLEPARYLFSEIVGGSSNVEEVRFTSARKALAALLAEEVDLAFVPLLSALQSVSEIELVPDVCIASSLTYPYATLAFKDDLKSVSEIQFLPEHAQEVLMQKIVSQEHYGLQLSFLPVPTAEEFDESRPRLLVNGIYEGKDKTLDLGSEWFDCTAYPAVWGVLICRKSTLTLVDVEPIMLKLLKMNTDVSSAKWLEKRDKSKVEENFFLNSLRTRIDMEVQAGLDSMVSFFYVHGLIDDMPAFPFLAEPIQKEPKDSDE